MACHAVIQTAIVSTVEELERVFTQQAILCITFIPFFSTLILSKSRLLISSYGVPFRAPFVFFLNLCAFQHVVTEMILAIKTQNKLAIDSIRNPSYKQMTQNPEMLQVGRRLLGSWKGMIPTVVDYLFDLKSQHCFL